MTSSYTTRGRGPSPAPLTSPTSARALVIGSGSAVQHIRSPISSVSLYTTSTSRADRATSVSRMDASSAYGLPRTSRASSRASSLTRAGSVSRSNDIYTVESSTGALSKAVLVTQPLVTGHTPAPRSRSASRTRGGSEVRSLGVGAGGRVVHRPVKIFFAGSGQGANGLPHRDDLREIYLPADYNPGQLNDGTPRSHVRVVTLPSGAQATAYEEEMQYGQGDHMAANQIIEDLVRRTAHLQDSMMTLEQFVKRNRQLFPEDTVVYQKITIYELTEDELRQVTL